MTNDNKYTGAAWRKAAEIRIERAVDLELPSGMTIKAVRPDLAVWMMQGRLPSTFTEMVVAANRDGDRDAAPAEITTAQIVASGQFVRDVVVGAVVRPKLVAIAAYADEMSYGDIPAEDIDFLFAWATRQAEAADLSRFRHERKHASPGADGPDVRNPAQHNRRNRRPGAGR